jgi:hypothetical protein
MSQAMAEMDLIHIPLGLLQHLLEQIAVITPEVEAVAMEAQDLFLLVLVAQAVEERVV